MPSESYWTNRYQLHETGWDIGRVSDPLKAYIDQLSNKQAGILIPGCGNAHEAAYLLEQGFTRVNCLDISPLPAAALQEHLAEKFQTGFRVICEDFFQHQGQYDLVLEQTFFCAIDPALRSSYAQKMATLLKPGGRLAGLLFDCVFEKEGPPFGGSAAEYSTYFEPFFRFKTFAPCYNSIEARQGRELFIILERI